MRQLFVAAFALCCARAAIAQINFTPYTLRTYDGQSHNIEIGKIAVTTSDTVAFYRLKSTTAPNAPPIVFLMGGPGIPATVMAPIPPYWQLFDALRASGDVILLDQRGLGLSSPNVDCPVLSTPFDTAFLTSHARLVSAYRTVVATCADYWRKKGVDPRQFSDVAIADDIEAIRKAMKSPKVNLLGFSYGTRLAMTYARRYPNNVSRLVLQGPTDPNLEYHESLQRDSLLERMAELAAGDSVSASFSQNLVARMRALLDRAGASPILVKIGRAQQRDSVLIPVGREGLQGIFEGHITEPRLPAFVATTERGDLTMLTRWVESMYNDFGGGAGTLMARALNCSARATAQRKREVDEHAKRSLFGGAFDNFASDPAFCSALGGNAPMQQARAARPIKAPVLFITGEFDDRTPPGNDAVLAKEFATSTRLYVVNGGHEVLPDPAVRKVVADFFAGADVRGRQLKEDRPRFMSIDAAKQPPRRRGG